MASRLGTRRDAVLAFRSPRRRRNGVRAGHPGPRPGAHLRAWPALVRLGIAVGLVLQVPLVTHAQLPVTGVLEVSLAASLVGLLSAKTYYLGGRCLMRRVLPAHRDDERPAVWIAGRCIQSFVTGALSTLVAGVSRVHARRPAPCSRGETTPPDRPRSQTHDGAHRARRARRCCGERARMSAPGRAATGTVCSGRARSGVAAPRGGRSTWHM